MNIKRIVAGLMAGILMCSGINITCFAFSSENAKNVPAHEDETTSKLTENETEDKNLIMRVTVDENGNYTYVYGDGENAAVTEDSSQASTQKNGKTGAALTPNGNLTLVDDDIDSTNESERQFITLVTKSGNYFYLIIDRNEKGEENVHFLNMVDEADLLSLMDEDQVEAYEKSKEEEEEAAAAAAASPTSAELEAAHSANSETAKVGKMSMNAIPVVGLVAIILACSGGYVFFQMRKKRLAVPKPDPDADYTEEMDEEEYKIPEEDEMDEDDYSEEEDLEDIEDETQE